MSPLNALEGIRRSLEGDLPSRPSGAHDLGGGAAVLGGDAAGGGRRTVQCGGLRASGPHVTEVRELELAQGGQRPATGVLAADHRVSRAQTAPLKAARLAERCKGPSRPFLARYTREDILHRAEIDPSHDTLSKSATRVPLLQAFPVFGDARSEH